MLLLTMRHFYTTADSSHHSKHFHNWSATDGHKSDFFRDEFDFSTPDVSMRLWQLRDFVFVNTWLYWVVVMLLD